MIHHIVVQLDFLCCVFTRVPPPLCPPVTVQLPKSFAWTTCRLLSMGFATYKCVVLVCVCACVFSSVRRCTHQCVASTFLPIPLCFLPHALRLATFSFVGHEALFLHASSHGSARMGFMSEFQ